MEPIPRYEPLIRKARWGEGVFTEFVACKNHYLLVLSNSKFIIPWKTSDSHMHQEEN